MDLRLLKIGPDRVKEVHEVIRKCSQHLRSRSDLGNYWNPPYPLELMAKDAAEKDVCAVRHGNRTVATFTLDTKPPTWFERRAYSHMWESPEKKAMYLGRLAVLPELQGSGIGSWCLARIEELAKQAGCVAIRLDAYERYTELLEFYEKRGYRRRGTISWRDMKCVCFEKILGKEGEGPILPRGSEESSDGLR